MVIFWARARQIGADKVLTGAIITPRHTFQAEFRNPSENFVTRPNLLFFAPNFLFAFQLASGLWGKVVQ